MIEHLVAAVTEAAASHWLLAYTIVGLMAAAEAMPVLGTVVPGSAVIVAVSALVPSGALDTWPLIAVSVAGAAAGDGFSFWLGRRYERGLVTAWPLRRYPQLVERAETLFRRHGGKSVFLARFIQGPRAFVPLVAGMSGMRPLRFYAFNLGSALLWAPSHVLGGVLLGASLHVVAAIAGRLALFLVAVVLLLWLALWLARRLVLGAALPALAALQERAAQWAAAEDTWLRRQLTALTNADRRETRALLLGGAVLIGSAWLFLGVLEDILTGDQLVQANSAVFNLLQSVRTVWGDRLMVAITEIGDGAVTTPVTLIILAWLAFRRSWRGAAYWLAAVGGAAVFTPIIKFAVHWPRPTALYSGWDAFSFPSGHATVNTALYGFLGFLVARELRPIWRVWVVAGVSALVALIGFSRLYLGAHWLADVVAGIAVGTAWVTILAMSYVRHRPAHVGPGPLLGVALVAVLGAWGLHMNARFTQDLGRYTPRPEVRRMTASAWLSGGYRTLPSRRIDLGGEAEEPLVLQWAGDLTNLRRALVDSGWRSSVSWSVNSAARWLSASAGPLGLPVLPRLHDGRPPDLTLVHASGPENEAAFRLVLLAWSSEVKVTGGPGATVRPLWVAAVFRQQVHRPLGLFSYVREAGSVNAARDLLAGSLAGYRLVTRQVPGTDSWDGRLLLGEGNEASANGSQ